MSDGLYFDYAAASPLDDQVLAAMLPFMTQKFYNPSATYQAGRMVRQALENARAAVARQLGAKPSEIIFTAGGTEANNLAIHGVMRRYPNAQIVTSAVEHEAVLRPAEHYAHRLVPVQSDGRLDISDLQAAITDHTVLVSLMHANNEVGTLQPLREAGQLVAAVRRDRRQRGLDLPLYLHSDACQAANYLAIHVSRLGVDLLTLNGGKMYGPKQSGVLYVKGGVVLQPLIDGGGQEQGLRSGTENIAAAIGLSAALDIAQAMRPAEVKRLQALQTQFIDGITAAVPPAVINGSRRYRLPNNVHVTLPHQDNERLLTLLDRDGIIAAAGSACSASSGRPSHVLAAMGLSDADARASLRLTMGRQTDAASVEQAVKVLAQIVNA